jgi:hypothetical protein
VIRARVGRWLNPSALVLVGLCFVLPFATVSCDTPGGYGRAAPGGTTSYNGVDLAIGGEPAVTPPDRVRPAPPGTSDRVWQPAAAVVLVLVVAGVVLTVRISDRRVRRATLAGLSGVAATTLLVNQALVQAELAVRVSAQLTQPLPAGRTASDYVHAGPGFGLSLGLLLAVATVNGIGWLRARPRPALLASPDDQDTVRQE